MTPLTAAPPPQVVPIAWSLAEVQQAPPAQGAPPPPPPSDVAPADNQPVGEIVVQGEYGPPKSDPAEAINEVSYEAAAAIDRLVVEPVAYAYRDVLPEPIRDGLGNVVRNLGEPSNALNFLLQGKVGKAFETLGRLAINSTLGIGGLIDVAARPAFGLPYRKNGFANTLGYYGVGPGPYLFVPITGPTTVRDQIGVTLDQALLPLIFGSPFNRPAYGIFYFAVNGLDSRLRDDDDLAAIKASPDPYRARRESYLAKRRREIAELKGEPLPEPYVIPGSIPLPGQEAPGVEGLKRGPGAGDKGR
ncbi:MAG: VacJ family lipoprotein [Erythrobacter sp.]